MAVCAYVNVYDDSQLEYLLSIILPIIVKWLHSFSHETNFHISCSLIWCRKGNIFPMIIRQRLEMRSGSAVRNIKMFRHMQINFLLHFFCIWILVLSLLQEDLTFPSFPSPYLVKNFISNVFSCLLQASYL
jgi:hypothetical protein